MDFTDAPIDPQSAQRLHGEGLKLDLVDTGDREAFEAWQQAETRGFYGDALSDKRRDFVLEHTAYRRTTGVWDAADAATREPVATVSTWTTPLSLPGETSIPAWAISAVTVAPTHRRRGIARALLESELRTANACGVPIAALTASEATIYGRFGFAPSAFGSDITIDTRRARWSGPAASGRLRFIDVADLGDDARALFERSRRRSPGQIEVDDALWAEVLQRDEREPDTSRSLRTVRYDSVDGELKGFVIYSVTGGEADFSTHTAKVRTLIADTDEAYAALWRFLLELDLVAEVSAELRAVDEPVLWQISDLRAVRATRYDHLWLRILDPVAALEARRYSAPGEIVLDIADPLGFAEGRMLLRIDADGTGSVTRLEADAAVPADAAHVALSINSLASLYLGGVTASTLARAGRISEQLKGSVDVVDSAFRSPVAPLLSVWF